MGWCKVTQIAFLVVVVVVELATVLDWVLGTGRLRLLYPLPTTACYQPSRPGERHYTVHHSPYAVHLHLYTK